MNITINEYDCELISKFPADNKLYVRLDDAQFYIAELTTVISNTQQNATLPDKPGVFTDNCYICVVIFEYSYKS